MEDVKKICNWNSNSAPEWAFIVCQAFTSYNLIGLVINELSKSFSPFQNFSPILKGKLKSLDNTLICIKRTSIKSPQQKVSPKCSFIFMIFNRCTGTNILFIKNHLQIRNCTTYSWRKHFLEAWVSWKNKVSQVVL